MFIELEPIFNNVGSSKSFLTALFPTELILPIMFR